MFALFFCDLLNFCALEFPTKEEAREPREIIMECTSYVYTYPACLKCVCVCF